MTISVFSFTINFPSGYKIRNTMHHPIPAQLATPETLEFCQKIVPNVHPVLLNSALFTEAEEMDCFVNVEQAIAKKGGRAFNGWVIWQVPGVYIQAEFYCIWENNAREMLDVTPYPIV
ncbi:hypothetical protein [Cronobacter sakazakii]|uniref:hypothetical protein n=1 Tax=Cronobacter sakazakii TaxID=28141 RepID=UPI0011B00BF9|nr:hypothetical protein [Cronobacter sakazakii]ELY2665834.1 hypothetical protein [Cronobacter sakazakii]ELY2746335.1 hypothetical protein [Cronobacter sakazakii]ELY4369466.1 hypothetical protein [Cronobacter sakazakii]ELY4373441.1 hypothetical protein [Cronobacter sakazakii]